MPALILLLLAASLHAQQQPAPCLARPAADRPYSRERLLEVVKAQTTVRAEYLVRTCGVRDPFTPELEADLRRAGAAPGVIAAVRESAPPPGDLLSLTGCAVTPEQVDPGSPATVRFRATGAKSVMMNGEFLQGSEATVRPLQTTVYKLFAFSPTGGPSAQCSVTVRVRPAMPGNVKVAVNPKDGLRYVQIPAGKFQMGCASEADEPCQPNEKPAHEAVIALPIWIGQTEVTVEAYARFVAETGGVMPREPSFNPGWSERQLPVVNVSWNQAKTYCVWAGDLRLPTEAEWEYAARAGTAASRYGALNEIAWAGGSVKTSGPHKAGQLKANAFQLFDMLGNVSEWTADPFSSSYNNEPAGSQAGPESVTKAVRGGSWGHRPDFVRASARLRAAAERGVFSIGFRCAGEKIGR